MEKVFRRHVSSIVLAAVLFVQVIGLAMQVKRPVQGTKVPLIRIWAVTLVGPIENGLLDVQDFFRHIWRGYFFLHDVREENDRLRDENARLRLAQVNMAEDVGQAHRLQALLGFKRQFIQQTVAAQVVGGSGSEQSRIIYIDKGSNDGIKPDMAVIAPTGVVGKVVSVFPSSAQVLEINDQSSGVGAILEKSRLQGILRGNVNGEATLRYIMGGEKVDVGEQVLTSGGDRIFPKGLPIGQVTSVGQGRDVFLDIRVKPSARLDKLEEVLIITKMADQEQDAPTEGPQRAIDILAERLPTVPPKAPDAKATGAPGETPGVGSARTAESTEKSASNGIAGAMRKPGARANASPASGTAKPAANAAKPKNPPSTANPANGALNNSAAAASSKSKLSAGTQTEKQTKPKLGIASQPGASQIAGKSGVKVTTDMPTQQVRKSKPAQTAKPATAGGAPAASPAKDVTQ